MPHRVKCYRKQIKNLFIDIFYYDYMFNSVPFMWNELIHVNDMPATDFIYLKEMFYFFFYNIFLLSTMIFW